MEECPSCRAILDLQDIEEGNCKRCSSVLPSEFLPTKQAIIWQKKQVEADLEQYRNILLDVVSIDWEREDAQAVIERARKRYYVIEQRRNKIKR
jgi:hypothetical protein